MEFKHDLPEEEITLKNFGTLKRIAAYVNKNSPSLWGISDC